MYNIQNCDSYSNIPSSQTYTKLRGLSPQANYTDRATAACQWSFSVDKTCSIYWAQTEDEHRIQPPKLYVLDKTRAMYNIQNCDSYSNIPSSQTYKKSPWPQSASELYRPSDRRLSVKLVPTFCG
jgi:hypothetical protein